MPPRGERVRKDQPPDGQYPIDTYSHWFSQAYPEPFQRQAYLRSLIEGKPIPAANLRLAHLLLDGRIGNLVVTPNFDDFLSRALNLFGKAHVICDHPSTVGRIDPESPDLQLVHVHGTFWFYDCRNLKQEIADRAEPSHETQLSMAALLDRILARRSPLVLGYSGWEGDVVMTALRRRLASGMRSNVYWFCHSRASQPAAPWVASHPNVMFVLPPERLESWPGASQVANSQPIRRGHGDASGPEPSSLPPATEPALDPKLPALDVLDEIIRALSLEEPPLTRDPLAFFIGQLRAQLASEDSDQPETQGRYLMGDVIQKLEDARSRVAGATPMGETQEGLVRIRSALRRSQYREVIREAACPLRRRAG